MICSVNLTCRVSARLSQSLPALSELSVFFICFSCVYRLEHTAYNAKHMGKLWYFLMKNVTFRVLFTEGGTLWKKVPKRCQKVSGLTSPFWMHFCSKVIQRAPLGANSATHVCKRAPQGRPGPPREISKSVFEGPRGGSKTDLRLGPPWRWPKA